MRSAPIPLVDLYQVAKSVLQLQMLVAFGLRLAKPAELLAGCDLEHHHPEFSFFLQSKSKVVKRKNSDKGRHKQGILRLVEGTTEAHAKTQMFVASAVRYAPSLS